MTSMRFRLITLLCTAFASIAFAQKGTIRGTVYDDANGEGLIGVTVAVKGTTLGTITDFEGAFSLSVDPGVYDLQVSYVSYQTLNISEVKVEAGKVTVLDNLRLKEDVTTLESVTVTAEAIRNTESALITVKRKSANLLDGISAAKFSQIGDSDASEAVKRVTGVSVEGGRYVFVRGLGDRYTKTTLNSVDIPGLDPDRNSIQIDIFPTNLIENMIVLKSSVAEMPADFTGGVVNIETKDFPDYKIFNVSASIGFNPSMHFNNDYFMYEGGSTDWLGFDDGTRDLPAGARNPQETFPAPSTPGFPPAEANAFVNRFNKELAADNQTSLMDYSLSLSLANQFNFSNGSSLGYVFAPTYKSQTLYYDDAVFGEYQRPTFSNEYELVKATLQTGRISERNVLLGGLGGLAFKTQRTKLKLTAMHLQSAEKRAGKFFIDDNSEAVGKSGFFGGSDNLEFSQRGVTNLLLNGEHYSENKRFSIDWRISPTISKIEEPDIRKTAFTFLPSDTVFSPGNAGNPTRIWRYLDEFNLVSRIDLKREYTLFGADATLKFGGSYVFKERDYEILSYDLQFFGQQPEYNGNPDNVLRSEFIYPTGTAYFSSGNATPNSNEYNSTVNNTALYISNQFKVFKSLTAILGLRAENFVQRHTGRDVTFASGNTEAGQNLVDAKVLDNLHFFPSANLIYALNEKQNLRASYSRTIARPSFKELSFAQILDPLSNRIFNGGLFRYPGWDGNLRETLINNIDLRWELFMKRSEILSVSAFYKQFADPIELVRIPQAQTTNEFQPRNVGNGTVLGVEFEFRKSLDIFSYALRNLYLSSNVTIVRSELDMTQLEFDARKQFEKDGQTIEDTREMAGQAPYIINAGLSYEDADLGIDGGLFYNVNGSTLTVVGGGLFPDVFSEPFHSLNLNINKTIGAAKKATLTFNVSNMLNDVRENFYEGFRAEPQLYTRLNPGRSFSIGFKYNLE